MKLSDIDPREKVDPQTRDRLIKSVDRVARYVSLGYDPTEALRKAASEDRLLPDQIRLVGRAFNTAQVLTQGGKGRNVLEKTAAQPLCNPEEVVEELWSEESDDFARLRKTSEWVESYYQRDPEELLRTEGLIRKAASSPADAIGEKQTIVIGYPGLSRPRREGRTPTENLGMARAALSIEVRRLNGLMEKLARYIAAAEESSAELLAEAVRAELPEKAADWVVKNASEASSRFPRGFKSVHGVPEEFNETLREAAELHRQVERAARRIKQAIDKEIPKHFQQVPLDLEALRKQLTEDLEYNPIVRKIKDDDIIIDLITSDPAFSSYSVEEIRGALSDIKRMFPKISKQPVVAKTLLRKYLTYGGLDPAEIRNLYQVEQMAQGKIPIKEAMEKAAQGLAKGLGDIGKNLIRNRLGGLMAKEVMNKAVTNRLGQMAATEAAEAAASRAAGAAAAEAAEAAASRAAGSAASQAAGQAAAKTVGEMSAEELRRMVQPSLWRTVRDALVWMGLFATVDPMLRKLTGATPHGGGPVAGSGYTAGGSGGGFNWSALLPLLGNPLITGAGGLTLGALMGGGKGALIGGLGGFLLPIILSALMSGGRSSQSSLQMQQLMAQQAAQQQYPQQQGFPYPA